MSGAYNPNREGWGFASVVCLLTAGLAFTAYTIHKNTYRHPRDPMAVQVYHDRDKAGSAHGEAAGPSTHGPAAAGDSTHGAATGDTAKKAGGH